MQELYDHLNEVAEGLGCVIEYKHKADPMMYVEEEPARVVIPYLEDYLHYGIYTFTPRLCYFAGLHELGHVYHGHTQGRPPFEHKRYYFDNGVFKSEAEAWEYALDHSIIEFTDGEKRFALKCLDSYLSYCDSYRKGPFRLMNGNRHHVAFMPDEITPYIESIRSALGAVTIYGTY